MLSIVPLLAAPRYAHRLARETTRTFKEEQVALHKTPHRQTARLTDQTHCHENNVKQTCQLLKMTNRISPRWQEHKVPEVPSLICPLPRLQPTRGSVEHCKHPQRGPGQSPRQPHFGVIWAWKKLKEMCYFWWSCKSGISRMLRGMAGITNRKQENFKKSRKVGMSGQSKTDRCGAVKTHLKLCELVTGMTIDCESSWCFL